MAKPCYKASAVQVKIEPVEESPSHKCSESEPAVAYIW
jgi:hypothetical protein